MGTTTEVTIKATNKMLRTVEDVHCIVLQPLTLPVQPCPPLRELNDGGSETDLSHGIHLVTCSPRRRSGSSVGWVPSPMAYERRGTFHGN